MMKESNPDWGVEKISALLLRAPPSLPAPRPSPAFCMRPATRPSRPPLAPIPTRFATLSGPRRSSCGRPTCSRSSSSGRTGASTSWPSWTITAASCSAMAFTPVSHAPWSWRSFGPRPTATALRGGADRQRQSIYYVAWQKRLHQGTGETRRAPGRGLAAPAADPGQDRAVLGDVVARCVESAVFIDLGDARQRIGLFIDHYNFQRPHQGIGGLVPADRFFGAAPDVLRTLQARVAANALELARQGLPKAPFYLTGQVGGQPFGLHAEGDRVILTGAAGSRARGGSGAPGGAASPDGRGGGATAARLPAGSGAPQSGGLPGAARPRNVAAGRGAAAGGGGACGPRKEAGHENLTHAHRPGRRHPAGGPIGPGRATRRGRPRPGSRPGGPAAGGGHPGGAGRAPDSVRGARGAWACPWPATTSWRCAPWPAWCRPANRGGEAGSRAMSWLELRRECEQLAPGSAPSTSGGPGHPADGRADGTTPGRTPAGGGATPAPADRPRLKGGGATPGRHRRGGAACLPCGRGGTVTFRVAEERRG